MHGECERARQWASADVDGELSAFEQAVLEGHLSGCPSCIEFRASIAGITGKLQAAPYQQLERPIEIARRRRRVSMRLAPAAAAMAVAAVGLGSILASSEFRSGSVSGPLQSESASAGLAGPDTMDLRTAEALSAARAARVATRHFGSLRGGPVVRER